MQPKQKEVCERVKMEPLHEKTPIIKSAKLSKLAGREVLLKLDNLQPPGSFKIRGIGNLVQKGVSSGAKLGYLKKRIFCDPDFLIEKLFEYNICISILFFPRLNTSKDAKIESMKILRKISHR